MISMRSDTDVLGPLPKAQQIVAHYRKLRGMNWEQVAEALGIGAKAVYYAEHEGRGLDSIARLRQLSALLHIPPALLGLCAAPRQPGWWIAEYEPWPDGGDGWPQPGAVIRSYRRFKRWTQSDLAESLDIQELAVCKMEKSNTGLDSLSRRRALCFVLSIPPLLLGLDDSSSRFSAPALLRSDVVVPPLEEIQSAQQHLWNGYYTGHGFDELKSVDWLRLQQLKDAFPVLPSSQRQAYLEQISLTYQAAGNIMLAGGDVAQFLAPMNIGIEYAHLSGDAALLSTALGRKAAGLWELGEQEQAEKSIREALFVAPDQEKIKRYPVASRILSCSALDRTDRAEVYAMLDQIVPNDRYQNGVDSNIVLWCRAQVYNNLAQNAPNRATLAHDAADLLECAEASAPDTLRRKLIIKVELARAYAARREYDFAATTTIEALQLMQQARSVLYLRQLTEVYQALTQSSHATSPQVARLGLLLFN